MSDTQEGPDWWIASDGKWYPPESASGSDTGATDSSTAGDSDAGYAAPDTPAGGSTDFGTPAADVSTPPAYGTPPPPGSASFGTPPPSPAYGAPAYGAPPPSPATNSGATTSLILGIASLLMCGLITGIPAIFIGRKARKEIAESNGQQGGDGMALGGLITGIIGTIWSVLGILAFIGILILGASVDDDDIRFDDDLGEINSDPSDGDCDESRFLQDPDC
jgi:hypothetical protein